MNGSTTDFILWIVNGLVSLVVMLIGFIVKMHQKSDEEHRNRMDTEITRLRGRLHDAESKLSGLEILELKRLKK